MTFYMCSVHIALICDILWFTIKKNYVPIVAIKVNLQNKKRTIKNGLLCHNIQKHFVKFVVYFSNQKYSHNRREKLSHNGKF